MNTAVTIAIVLVVVLPVAVWMCVGWRRLLDRLYGSRPADPRQAAEDLIVCEALWALDTTREK